MHGNCLLRARRFGDERSPTIVAHRGLWSSYPENSVDGMIAAFAAGADIVELDVRRARDGAFVIIDDERLERTTDLKGRVDGKDLVDLRKARLRHGAGGLHAGFSDSGLASLDEVLLKARGRGLIALNAKACADIPAIARFVSAMDASLSVVLKSEVSSPAKTKSLLEDIDNRALFMPIVSSSHSTWLPALIHDLRPLGLPCFEVHCQSIEELNDTAIMAATQKAGVWVNSLECSHIPGFNDAKAVLDPGGVWGGLVDHGATIIQSDEVAALIQHRQAAKRAA